MKSNRQRQHEFNECMESLHADPDAPQKPSRVALVRAERERSAARLEELREAIVACTGNEPINRLYAIHRGGSAWSIFLFRQGKLSPSSLSYTLAKVLGKRFSNATGRDAIIIPGSGFHKPGAVIEELWYGHYKMQGSPPSVDVL